MGATDRLPNYSLSMFVFGANHYQACSGLDIDGRQFVFGADLELGADSEKFVENLEYFPNTMLF